MECSNLSSDLIFEILTRTSLKSLDRCKSVCKGWNNLTYESNFTPLHCERTGTISGYFVQNLKHIKHYSKFVSMDRFEELGQNLSLDFLPHPVKVEASSNQGILCCVSAHYKNYRFYVCKPSTRQWQAIPNPKMRYMTIKVAIVVVRSDPLRYKIVRLSNRKKMLPNYYNFLCEIFDSDEWTWRELNDVLLPPREMFVNQPAIVVSGVIHWLISNNYVLAFDVNTETYTMFGLPDPVLFEEDEFHYKNKRLAVYKGQLAFVCSEADEYFILWVMDTNREWRKRQTLDIEAIKEKEPYPSCVAFYNGDIALVKGYESVMFYGFQNCNLNNEKKQHCLMMNTSEVFAFRSDLEPIDLKSRS